jgi:serine/threonine protein kinase
MRNSIRTARRPLRTPHAYSPRTLRSELQEHGRLPPAECIILGLKLAAALQHLHANGLVHRDIKPSNIIFVKGEPKLADIGLVTANDEAQSLVGTVGYIPPEGPGTPQADLYSLGKVLYEIALGKDRQDFPQLPPDLSSHAEYGALLELNEVILKACETDPRRRYQTAEELRCDLALLQRGESVKSKRRAQRRWALTWKTSVAVAAVALAVAGGWQLFYGLAFQRLSAPISRPVIPREAKVIAVLPFDNESPDKGDDYLGKQMAEELSTALSRIPSLRVLGRDSAATLKTAPDRRIAAQKRKLVAVLDGRVRKSGTQLHLAAQLVNPADGLVLWSDDCDGEIREFFAIQTRLGKAWSRR